MTKQETENTRVFAAPPVWLRQLVKESRESRINRHLRQLTDAGERSAHATTLSRAAVLMLFSADLDVDKQTELPPDASLLLTHRHPEMRSHAGQVAFPGGRQDPEDRDSVDCAIREAWEETGLDRHSVSPLTCFEDVRVRVSGRPVTPVLGYWNRPEPDKLYAASPRETDHVFWATIEELRDPKNRLTVGYRRWRFPAFTSHGYLIWGLTGSLIHATLRYAGWEIPWDDSAESTVDLVAALRASRNNEPLARAGDTPDARNNEIVVQPGR